jgi:hypothetical protein
MRRFNAGTLPFRLIIKWFKIYKFNGGEDIFPRPFIERR